MFTFAGLAAALAGAGAAEAQSLSQALSSAYSNNATLNAARAEIRGVHENVAIARGGYRPQLSANAETAFKHLESVPGASRNGIETSLGLTVRQDLFKGFQTTNATRQAEAGVRAQRQSLRSTEQTILLEAVVAFADVIQNEEILRLNRSNLRFLDEQVRASQDRFDVGEGTRTDISQSQADRQIAQSDVFASQANLAAARAEFLRVTGIDAKNLRSDMKIRRLLPNSLRQALRIAADEHPEILSALHAVDSAAFNVKQIEGRLLPTVSVEGSASSTFYPVAGSGADRTDSASIVGRVTVPIYQGGIVSAQVRQAKEQLGQARIVVDIARDQIRATTIAAWNNLFASNASIRAAQAGVEAARLALEGVIEENRVGQRTRLDILDQQSRLILQQISLARARRTRLVSAYSLISAIGRLNAAQLNLHVVRYEPKQHYRQVRDKWFGLRTPDGR